MKEKTGITEEFLLETPGAYRRSCPLLRPAAGTRIISGVKGAGDERG
ncbi:MAG TPA: hypothetical protein PK175_09920 [Syntrophales bacterium]|nr:hypothetical protein [Syntrophales bacterium]HOU78563.1 hypothetical protein [Syntrophales bacterium]HPC33669.1 hypothetical protein [Syntrophales bacterium]HQG35177.1 hypothetical protein [Syntrophales bacterium]HQI36684.1 hypothetical protein [Syntrophales bacterium]